VKLPHFTLHNHVEEDLRHTFPAALAMLLLLLQPSLLLLLLFEVAWSFVKTRRPAVISLNFAEI